MCCDCFISPCQVADSALQPPEPRQQGMHVCSPVRRGKEGRGRVKHGVSGRGGIGRGMLPVKNYSSHSANGIMVLWPSHLCSLTVKLKVGF